MLSAGVEPARREAAGFKPTMSSVPSGERVGDIVALPRGVREGYVRLKNVMGIT